MAKTDAGYAQALLVERLAEQDAVFAENYRSLQLNRKYRQLIPSVTKWLVQSALARARREGRTVMEHRPIHVNMRRVNNLEQELYGRAA